MSTNGSIQDRVKAYWDSGLQVIPIRTDGSKAPAIEEWKPYQDPLKRLNIGVFTNCGVAILGGMASGGLEILDFDDPSVYGDWCELVEWNCPGLVQRLLIVETPRLNEAGERGKHVFYRCDQPSGNVNLAFDKPSHASIQTRGEGGYVVAPGSPAACHETGRCYELLAGDFREIPHITMSERGELFAAARALSEVDDQKSERTYSEPTAAPVGDRAGDEFAASTSWANILAPHGWKQLGNGDLWRRPGKERGWSASTKCQSKNGNQLFRCFTSSAPPFEMDNTYSKFAVFTLLNHNGDYRAAAKALHEQGFGMRDNSDVDLSSILDDQVEHSGDGGAAAEPPHKMADFGRMTSAELFGQDFTVNYLIENILADGQHGVISGRFKSQKTHIAVAAAVAIATGAKFLNHFDVPTRKRVGVFCGEGGPAPLQRMGRAIAAYQGVDTADLANIVWFTRVPRVNDKSHQLALVDAIQSDKLDLIFLDPTYLLLSGVGDKASNYMVMADTLALLTTIGEQTGTTCIVCHHNKKTGLDFSVPELGDLSFSGTSEWAGQWVLLGHRAAFDANTRQTRLWMNVGGRMGHGGCWGVDVDEFTTGTPVWSATVSSAEETRKSTGDAKRVALDQKRKEAAAEIRERIKDAFRGPDNNPDTKARVRERSGHKGQLFDEVWATMLREQAITEVQITRPNRKTPYAGYQLNYGDE